MLCKSLQRNLECSTWWYLRPKCPFGLILRFTIKPTDRTVKPLASQQRTAFGMALQRGGIGKMLCRCFTSKVPAFRSPRKPREEAFKDHLLRKIVVGVFLALPNQFPNPGNGLCGGRIDMILNLAYRTF